MHFYFRFGNWWYARDRLSKETIPRYLKIHVRPVKIRLGDQKKNRGGQIRETPCVYAHKSCQFSTQYVYSSVSTNMSGGWGVRGEEGKLTHSNLPGGINLFSLFENPVCDQNSEFENVQLKKRVWNCVIKFTNRALFWPLFALNFLRVSRTSVETSH